ncbi:MAG: UPF0182 family protein [Actinomycetota bacterium]|nr:UPF0182 family protein [Actinomycetota bacterium]
MSEVFGAGEGTAPPVRPRRVASRRPRALLPTLAVVVVLVVLASIFVEIWTDRLWYQSLGFGSVFTRILWTRVALFMIFGLVFAGAIVGNVILAYRTRPILLSDGYRNPTIERYQDAVDPFRRWILVGLGATFFLFAGASASGRWKTYMLWRNAVPFGQGDVYFHKDIGFYVFGYPWYRYLLSFGFTVLVFAVIAAGVTHYLYGAIRLPAKHNRVTNSAQIHLSVLLGLFVSLKAVAYWLDRYGLAIHNGSLITGITYTDVHAVLPSKNVLMIISIISALLFFGNVVRPGWLLPLLGFGLLVLSAILIGGIWPMIVQRFQVKPSEPNKEGQYIQRNIAATRNAYGLDGVQILQYPGETTLTAAQQKTAADALPGVRVIDPRLVSQAFVQLQQMRGFYTMPDVLDVDRYAIGSSTLPKDVIISARELNLNGLRGDQRNWNNDHTVYTHGFGVVAAYAERRGDAGQPVWAEKNLPSTGQLGAFRQQIYFGESEPNYSIVGAPTGTPPVELNIPSIGGTTRDQNSTYKGTGGVGIGSTFRQMLYSAKFWDSSILLSTRVHPDSRLIYNRDPLTMVKKIAPWLAIDGNAYPAVVNGRLLWIMDGFTTSADYPMSDLIDLNQATSDSLTPENAVAGQPSDKINYIRNSAKVTVDAYSGQVKIYQWDEKDPILRTWMNAFPGVVSLKSDILPDLLAHLRYPEDLFKVQRQVLSTYHVTEASIFYNGSENWRVPEDPTDTINNQSQPPYYLTVRLPGEAAKFSLTSAYVPQSRSNLASLVSVDANPVSTNYGRITVLQLPSDNTVAGPGQMANQLKNDPDVTRKLLPYERSGTKVLRGNLLTLPLAGEMLYAQPVYTFGSGTASYPLLQFVTVALGNNVGIGKTFDQAVASALGVSQTPPGGDGGPPSGGGGNGGGGSGSGNQTVDQRITALLAQSKAAFDRAQAALENGDLAGYQASNAEGLRLLDQAIALREQQGTPTTGPTSPTKSSPSKSPTSPTGSSP